MKKALITGVLGGIGSALAMAFRAEGYYVYGLDVREDFKFDCNSFVQFNLDDFCKNADYRKEWSAFFEKEITSLDVLINNAAVQKLDKLDDLQLEDWEETLNGTIINIGSIHYQLTKPRFISYATSKSALIGLTKALAVDLEGRVRVNAISPAAIETDMLLAGFDGDERALEELRRIHPVQRIGYPQEVAKLALFLASENTGFIHGASLTLDGGISSVLKDL